MAIIILVWIMIETPAWFLLWSLPISFPPSSVRDHFKTKVRSWQGSAQNSLGFSLAPKQNSGDASGPASSPGASLTLPLTLSLTQPSTVTWMWGGVWTPQIYCEFWDINHLLLHCSPLAGGGMYRVLCNFLKALQQSWAFEFLFCFSLFLMHGLALGFLR